MAARRRQDERPSQVEHRGHDEFDTVTGGRYGAAPLATRERVTLGRYHLLEVVGSGGMGVVWGAWDPELDRRVAVKRVKPTVAAARARILGEGQALARLSHPNVVPVYDVGAVDDEIYIVMEWVRGRTLRAHGKERRSVREIVAIYRAAGEGLAAAHRAGLIHRDFKPDNAILGDDGRVRVVDFGLARGEVRPAATTAARTAAKTGREAAGEIDDGIADQPGDKTGSETGNETGGRSSDGLAAGPELAAASPPEPAEGSRVGTPRYMAPEQVAGHELTPAVDQYAFGVALREALAGRDGAAAQAPIPRWLDEIAARATAAAAADRYATMDALLAALARDPAAARRRWLLVTAAIGAVGAGFAVGQRVQGDAAERCAGGAHAIARIWDDARGKLGAHLRGLGAYGAQEAARLDGELDRYGAAWAGVHRAACLAKDRGELTAVLYERSLGCLTRARVAFDTAIDLVSSVDSRGLPDALIAARRLPSPERCASEAQMSTVAPPRPEIAVEAAGVAADIERARVFTVAQAPAMQLAAEAAAWRADRLDYPPLVARAQLVLGRAMTHSDNRAAALALQRAQRIGFEIGEPAVAIEAYARELFLLAVGGRNSLPPTTADAPGALAMAEAIAGGLDERGAFARALLYNNAGALRYTQGDRSGARAWYQRALDASRTVESHDRGTDTGTDGDSNEVIEILGNLAKATDDPREQAGYFARQIAALDRELGPDHPRALLARLAAAAAIDDPRASIAARRPPCEVLIALHPHLAVDADRCMYELGWGLEELGDAAGARAAFAQVRVDSAAMQLASGFRTLLDGRSAESAAVLRALADDLDGRPQLWLRYRSVDARLLVALGELARGQRDAAVAQLQRALTTLHDTAAMVGGLSIHRRRSGRVHALLARTLAATDRAAAARHAADAAAWYRSAGGYDAQLRVMTVLLTTGSP